MHMLWVYFIQDIGDPAAFAFTVWCGISSLVAEAVTQLFPYARSAGVCFPDHILVLKLTSG